MLVLGLGKPHDGLLGIKRTVRLGGGVDRGRWNQVGSGDVLAARVGTRCVGFERAGEGRRGRRAVGEKWERGRERGGREERRGDGREWTVPSVGDWGAVRRAAARRRLDSYRRCQAVGVGTWRVCCGSAEAVPREGGDGHGPGYTGGKRRTRTGEASARRAGLGGEGASAGGGRGRTISFGGQKGGVVAAAAAARHVSKARSDALLYELPALLECMSDTNTLAICCEGVGLFRRRWVRERLGVPGVGEAGSDAPTALCGLAVVTRGYRAAREAWRGVRQLKCGRAVGRGGGVTSRLEEPKPKAGCVVSRLER